ncbi:MAG: tyrosine--tRNA ligase, partial [Candidatus Gracilibacteria bacterium]|nr:tyrosine--tRNA ligase [Candidatus Gracilibacteria bacterium]
MKKLKQELQDRGLLYQFSNEELFEKFDKGGESFYCGFDPTADSLHLGNFIGFMVAIHLMRRGNKYIALTGGATGMIGDPGGKDAERNFLSEEALLNNQNKISKQIGNILENLKSFTGDDFKYGFVNNKDFYTNMGYLDFLREVGKFITVNSMISKDTVKKRIEDPSKFISYTEFSYQLLQGYDFCKLFTEDDVKLQIGGQDQWGNLVTGTELIRKKYDKEAYVLTWPLITDSTGKKFGKSEGNALWLDKNKTSPYKLYQYFLNSSDNDIERYLKMLTLLDIKDIEKILLIHSKNPEDRFGQKLLAYKIVEIVHGTKSATYSFYLSGITFGWINDFVNKYSTSFKEFNALLLPKGNNEIVEFITNSSEESLIEVYNEWGGCDYNNENLFEIIVKSGLATSNSDARKTIESGAFYINEQKITDTKYDFSNDFINNKILLLRKGKKNFKLIIK